MTDWKCHLVISLMCLFTKNNIILIPISSNHGCNPIYMILVILTLIFPM